MEPPGQSRSKQPRLRHYEYSRLEVTGRSFRLLKFEESVEGKVRGSLHHFVLGSKEYSRYDALSYTWGYGCAEHKLNLLNNRSIWVRKNLHAALQAIRDESSSCWLWIDAICIDQGSS
jgi:hypothetical protein